MALEMKKSYLQSHYNVEETEYGYKFTTIAGVDYFLTFISYPSISDFLATNIYMFNIERNESVITSGQDDEKVRNTVLYVLDLFFSKHEDALISICDVIDGKQFARKRLFDSWFNKFNNNRLIKMEAECEIDGIPTFASLLYSANHYNHRHLEQEFQELVKLNFFN